MLSFQKFHQSPFPYPKPTYLTQFLHLSGSGISILKLCQRSNSSYGGHLITFYQLKPTSSIGTYLNLLCALFAIFFLNLWNMLCSRVLGRQLPGLPTYQATRYLSNILHPLMFGFCSLASSNALRSFLLKFFSFFGEFGSTDTTAFLIMLLQTPLKHLHQLFLLLRNF